MSEHSAAFQLGQFFGYLIPVAIGVAVSLHLRKKRGGDKVPGWPIITGLVVSLVGCVGANADNPAKAEAASESSVQVFEGKNVQPWPEQLEDSSLIEQFGNTFADEAARKFKAAKYPIDRNDISTGGNVIHRDGRKIVHVSMHAGNKWFAQFFVGQVNGSQFVVECMQDLRPIDLAKSGCAARVKEVFGYDPNLRRGIAEERG